MKRIIVIIAFLIAISLVSAQEDITISEDLTLKLTLSSNIGVNEYSKNSYLDSASVELNYLPDDSYRQKVLTLYTSPEAKITDKVTYFWDSPTSYPLSFLLESDIETRSDFVEIRNKVKYPITQYPPEVYEYTKPTSLIDVNDDIRKLAAELSEGEDDLYKVVFNLAAWTNQNIEYDLSSVAADAAEPSSWVLSNKRGVCDEMTNLFISMCRSLGIPARFVTGVSYTNDPRFQKPWGLHGWAEVYFPGYGWVPFDPTYGEYGYIDAGHIALKKSIDSNKTSTQYEWKGRYVDLEPEKINIDVEVLKKGLPIIEPIDISLQAYDETVGFGSYNYIETTIQNNNDYYITTEAYISAPEEVEVLGEKSRPVLLLPHEKKSLFFIIKTPENLDKRYIYTFPLSISTQKNLTAKTSYKADFGKSYYDYNTINDIISQKSDEASRNMDVLFYCVSDKEEADVNETVTITCTITNNRETSLNNVEICMQNACKEISVKSRSAGSAGFEQKFPSVGTKVIAATAMNSEFSKKYYTTIMVLDVPKINITELDYPSPVEFSEEFEISFIIDKNSYATPKNARVTLYTNKNKETWEIGSIESATPFEIQSSGKFLKLNENNMRIVVEYEDDNKKTYRTQKEFTIILKDTTFTEKIQVFLNQFLLWLDRLFE